MKHGGTNGPTLTGLGFGGAGVGNFGSAIGDEQAEAAINRAWQRGIRYFDTAPHYGLGLSERRLGHVLAQRPRHEFVISTKVGRLLVPRTVPLSRDDDGFDVPGELDRTWDFTLNGIRRSLAGSCDRLGVDQVDIVLVHDPDQAWAGAARKGLESLASLRSTGLVGTIGIGTNTTDGLIELIDDGVLNVVLLANRFTLLDHRDALPVLDAALHAGVRVVAAGVFNSGLLATARPRPATTFDDRGPSANVISRINHMADVCEAHGTDLPTVAIAFATRHPAVTAVLLGMRSAREVDENADRYPTDVPTGVWTDLVAERLLDDAVIDWIVDRPDDRNREH